MGSSAKSLKEELLDWVDFFKKGIIPEQLF